MDVQGAASWWTREEIEEESDHPKNILSKTESLSELKIPYYILGKSKANYTRLRLRNSGSYNISELVVVSRLPQF